MTELPSAVLVPESNSILSREVLKAAFDGFIGTADSGVSMKSSLGENEGTLKSKLLPVSQFGLFLKSLKVCSLEDFERDVVRAQASLRFLYQNGDVNEGIPFPLFYKWYKLEHLPGIYDRNNELLVRKTISKVKLPTRNIREAGFVYGEKNKPDKEGSGEVIFNWVTGNRSKSRAGGVSLLKVNKEAVKQKKTTPREFSRFLNEHKNDAKLQKPVIVGRKKDTSSGLTLSLPGGKPYGKPSPPPVVKNFSEIIFPNGRSQHIVSGSGGEEHIRNDNAPQDAQSEHNYVDMSGQQKKGKLPFPRPTKGSLLQRQLRQENTERAANQQKHYWKLKKYDRVKSKVHIPGRSTRA